MEILKVKLTLNFRKTIGLRKMSYDVLGSISTIQSGTCRNCSAALSPSRDSSFGGVSKMSQTVKMRRRIEQLPAATRTLKKKGLRRGC